EVGSQHSLATAHLYNLTNYLSPGSHTISILVDNRIKNIDPGINSHSIADHTQSNWNGIVGKIELSVKPKIQLDDIRIFPDVVNGKVTVKGNIVNFTGIESNGSLTISTVLNSPGADPPKIRIEEKVEISLQNSEIAFEFSLGDELGIWDEFYPNLYTMKILLETKTGRHENEITFGMRKFEIDGTRFSVNGRPTFLRGTLECAIFPKTGYPPTDVNAWKRIINVAKSHGLNHMRFHSWCPPEAAFTAADQLGFYLQVECSSWANQSTRLGDGLPVDKFVYDESERIVKMYGNHPSFCMMTYGNEPRGKDLMNYLADFINYWKEKDNRRVYTGGAGWPILFENDYHNLPQPRIQGWGEGLNSIINSQSPRTDYDWSDEISDFEIPVVSHEIGQWCVYPNFKEIEKYDGVLKAKNFEIF
ncbi:MAG: beta-glucuronidase, partial [Cyclobacteriaceae bacterium]|nr:beta-glucuronidase [Cyclobacteriaceae bacterium]